MGALGDLILIVFFEKCILCILELQSRIKKKKNLAKRNTNRGKEFEGDRHF